MGFSWTGGLDYLVLNHLGAAPAGTRAHSAPGTSWLLQVLRPFSTRPCLPASRAGAPSLLSPGPTSKFARLHPVFRLWLLTLLALQPFLPRLHPLPHPSLGSGPPALLLLGSTSPGLGSALVLVPAHP